MNIETLLWFFVIATVALLVGYLIGRRHRPARSDAETRSSRGGLSLSSTPPVQSHELMRAPTLETNTSTSLSPQLVMGSPDDPLFTVALAAVSPHNAPSEAIELPAHTKTALASLLQHAPRALAVGGVLESATKLTMVFKPETVRALSEGTLSLTPSSMEGAVRAIARSPDGRFVEHANIVSQVNPTAVATAVWQVAAIVTSQKYLADINARLLTLENGVAGIMSFLEDSVAAKVRANLEYLRGRAETIQSGSILPLEMQAIVHQLEDIDRDTRSVASLMQQQVKRHTDELAAANWRDSYFDAGDKQKEAERTIVRGHGTATILLFSAQVRLLSLFLRNALGLHNSYTVRSLDAVDDDLKTFSNSWSSFADELDSKLLEIGATFQRGKTDIEQRKAVRLRMIAARKWVVEETDLILSATKSLKEATEYERRQDSIPLALELDIDAHGRVLRSAKLLRAPNSS